METPIVTQTDVIRALDTLNEALSRDNERLIRENRQLRLNNEALQAQSEERLRAFWAINRSPAKASLHASEPLVTPFGAMVLRRWYEQ